jgi:PAS domain S-box-containing protein
MFLNNPNGTRLRAGVYKARCEKAIGEPIINRILALGGRYPCRCGEDMRTLGTARLEGSKSKRMASGFLAGGGEMGSLMRALDWDATPLGPPEQWPQSLKTAVRIMLTSRQPIWIGWGSELIYLYNDPYKSIIGGKHPWALGKPTSTVWQEIWGDIGPMLATAMTGIEGTYVEEQLLIMERNGYPEETYYTFSYSPIPDDDGSAGGIICANTDDTKRVIGERQLSLLRQLAADASEARTWQEAVARSLRALSTNPRDVPFAMLYDVDAEGEKFFLAGSCGIEGTHPPASSIVDPGRTSQWPLHEALRTQQPVLVDDLAAKFPDGLATGAWAQSPRQAVLLPILPNGETSRAAILVVGLNPFRLFDEGYRGFLELTAGQIAATIANAQAYEEERRRAEALEEINRQKTAFFSNVSHEFRTPLTLMLGPLEDLLADPASVLGEESRALVEVAHRNALRLLKLVNSLLDFSRLEAGRARADFEPVDLTALTAEFASNFSSVAEKARLKFEVAGDKLDAPVYVDRDMWEKVVLNLLSNAFKFTLDGGIYVALRASTDRKAAELTVSDTGAGIPADQLPKLFDRFYQVGGQKGRSLEGSGIGLALVREIVSLHGGNVEVKSEPGRGSSFIVRIPFGIAHLPPEQVVMDASAIGLASKRDNAYVEEALRWIEAPVVVPAENGGTQKPRILIADDNADMRDYMTRLLGDRWTIESVEDGVAALDAIKTKRPDLVLTDVMMPKLDGFGLLKAIRSDVELQDLPVIMLSARAGEEARVEALDAGADDYLTKPFSARELVARVGANLKLAEVRRQASEALKLANEQLAADKETVDRLNRQLATESERLRHLFEQAPGFMCVLRGPDHVFELANGAYLRLVGQRDLIGKRVREAFPEVEGQDFFEMLDGVFATGEPVEGRSRPIQLQRNGRQEPRYLDFIYQPIADERGVVTGIFVEGYDVTDRVVGQTELAEREAEFRALADNMSQFAWMTGADGLAYWFNKRWLDYTGTSLADITGWGWRVAIHPDHADQVLAKIKMSFMSGEPWEDTFPIRSKDGEYRWFLSRALPIRDSDGRIIRWFGTNTDITDRLKADEQRVLLINELNHRVKNTLATVQSLAMQTLRNTERSADARDLFESRLTALSRAHDVLTVESWEGAELRRVASRALEPFASKDGRVSIDGPDVWLTPKQALALSMTLHELATNATKYGALSNDAGTVRVSWVVAPFDGSGELELTWTEQGGPPVSQPTRKGFGTRLIQRNLAHDLGGDATIDYRPQGVVSVIRSPIEKPHRGSHQ